METTSSAHASLMSTTETHWRLTGPDYPPHRPKSIREFMLLSVIEIEMQAPCPYWEERSALRCDEHVNIAREFHLVVVEVVINLLPGDQVPQCCDVPHA